MKQLVTVDQLYTYLTKAGCDKLEITAHPIKDIITIGQLETVDNRNRVIGTDEMELERDAFRFLFNYNHKCLPVAELINGMNQLRSIKINNLLA